MNARVLGSDATRAVDRFQPDGPRGYCAATLPDAPLRATRAEAEADEARWLDRPRRTATRGLMSAAGRAIDAPRGSVAQIDARTSANDWRAALSIARGTPLDRIDPHLGTS